jgi:hypothetical protein
MMLNQRLHRWESNGGFHQLRTMGEGSACPLFVCGLYPLIPPPSLSSSVVTSQAYGPRGREPTRYGDWEIKGRCTDFS